MTIKFLELKKNESLNQGDATIVRFSENKQNEFSADANGARTLLIGLGQKVSEQNLRGVRLSIRRIISSGKAAGIKKIILPIEELRFKNAKLSDKDLGEMLGSEFNLANFDFVKYKSIPDGGFPEVEEVTIVGKVSSDFKKGVLRGEMIALEVNATRTLANTPGGEMTPQILAREATQAAKGLPIKVTVLGVKEMEKLGMGAILGVGKGSHDEPKFIVMEYMAGKKSDRPTVLVGKGVTFDTGGLNLKPSEFMYEMHLDMSGGAACIHAIVLAAKLKLKKNIITLVPAVENMPSGSSYRPGDVLRSMSGKTIEVLNTDAEGRVILADGLTYAKKYNPKLVIDVATLTGAACVALGNKASAIFTKDQNLENETRKLGEASGDYVWPMPLWDEYEPEIAGTFGDWANLGKLGRLGGAIAAAMFLYQFAKDLPKDTKWLHIDMAPRMTSYEGEFLAKGAVGAPVRLLLALIEKY